MRTLETHPKAVPWKIDNALCVVTGLPRVVQKKCTTGLSKNAIHYHPIHVGPSTQQVIINQGLGDFEESWSLGFVLDPTL